MHELIACGFYKKTTPNGKKVFDNSYKNALALAPLKEVMQQGSPVFLTSFPALMEQRGKGAEGQRGKNLVFLFSPLLLCTPAQAQALRGVVRNPGSKFQHCGWMLGVKGALYRSRKW
jgi:hypothetical protein